MATEVRWRRGSAADHASFTGAEGEVTVDTDDYSLRTHDGQTAGGFKNLTANSTLYVGVLAVTDNSTDEFQFSAADGVNDGQVITAAIPAANSTASPTLENTGGSPSGAKDIVTTAGAAFIGMLEARAHRFQWDDTAGNWIVLDPAGGVVNKGENGSGKYTIWGDGTFEATRTVDITDSGTSQRFSLPLSPSQVSYVNWASYDNGVDVNTIRLRDMYIQKTGAVTEEACAFGYTSSANVWDFLHSSSGPNWGGNTLTLCLIAKGKV